jgi:uncharacterized protein
LRKPQIIIAAIASRAYVQAAVNAGFDVIAIDAFCDVDTQMLALQTLKVDTKNGSFIFESLNKALSQIDCTHVLAMIIGAGFEAAPEILESLPVASIFNQPSIIQAVKNPTTFFAFLDSISAPHPTTQLARPANTVGWLQKQIGGSGGAHIKAALPLNLAENIPVYYQQQCAGEPYGCLFLADSSNAQIIGFHQQWCEPTVAQPYRFGGAVSHVELPAKITELIESYVQKMTLKFNLRGINSIDFLLNNNELNILEVNPRLSASLQLYSAKKGNLFAAHVQACLNQPIDWPIVDKTSDKASRAMQIVYANKTAQVPAEMDWPDWVCDIPQPNSEIAAGAPLCSVVADARTAKLARKKLMQRVALL